ncbi:hypothetical protein GJW-30_1_02452 [Variibacter gotjawalensis]|uniref:Putative hydro-lyase GJW-30_1_02452 n=1 Tax=Variibacter gotjawalensis TaxID=1333996 RepID=A0A0S3PVH4_9BRAD|nr:putative hydro-lyase [Variibacter gotjawalensis]NIK45740.1 uncharacterized protein YcsI (UPF0317 family) [Variibacter gotjawalensis]RZS47664.1 uncharacterized protein YcsI (UPF0317 family) [Variibacter gotjawalensis]BAT59917.1 hypothetical protein GJW-30_1_02452 [Variibacter gotjawalensis]
MNMRDPKLANADLSTGRDVRLAARSGRLNGWTAGLAPGYVQGNLAILPREQASDFAEFCRRNPKPCPVIGTSAPGDWRIPELGADFDIRTDLPRYRVWKDGEMIDEPASVEKYWRDDLVAFVIGCSFTFEEALMEQGIPMQHITRGVNVPMYRTSIDCVPAGPFHGPTVVSMRPMTPGNAIRAVQVTSRFPSVHGAPIHIGLPEEIGIKDVSVPDYGDAADMKKGELPVFWACGVTPQAVIAAAKVPFAITHAPGAMVVTDLKNAHLAVL